MSNTFPENISSWPYVKVYGLDFRPQLLDIATTIEKLHLWDWFRNESPPEDLGYMWWGHENIKLISNEKKIHDHSGATFAYALRCMQSIAKNGFDPWKDAYAVPE